jgi:hypothetical protein
MKTKNSKRKTESDNAGCVRRLVSTPHETDWTKVEAKMLQYRKEHFEVEVTPDKHALEPGQICLSVTSNGNQWTSFSLLKCEVEKVIAALSANIRS